MNVSKIFMNETAIIGISIIYAKSPGGEIASAYASHISLRAWLCNKIGMIAQFQNIALRLHLSKSGIFACLFDYSIHFNEGYKKVEKSLEKCRHENGRHMKEIVFHA